MAGFIGSIAASILAPTIGNAIGGGGGLLGGIFGGGGGGGTQSPNSSGYAPAPDQAPAPNYPQYNQTDLINAQQTAKAQSDAQLAVVQAQAQAVAIQQQAQNQIDKMAITAQLSQQSQQLKQAQAQLAAATQAQAASGTNNLLPILAVGAVLLVVLMK